MEREKQKVIENIMNFVIKWDTDSEGNHDRVWLEAQISNQLEHFRQFIESQSN